MRIGIVAGSLEARYGGPASKAIEMALALERGGAYTVVMGPAHRSAALPSSAELHQRVIPLSYVAKYRNVPLGGAWRLNLQRFNLDLLHVIGYREPTVVWTAAHARRRDLLYLLEPAGSLWLGSRRRALKTYFDALVGRRVVEGAAAVVVNSLREQSLAVDAGWAHLPFRLRWNGVGVQRHQLVESWERRELTRQSLGLSPQATLVVALGRLSPDKRFNLLLDALALDALSDVSLVVAGPIESESHHADLVCHDSFRPQRGSVRMLLSGGLWGDEKWDLLAAADLLCLPSVSESFGTAAAEALVMGIPALVSPGVGMANELTNPLLVMRDMAEPASVARALHELLQTHQALGPDSRPAREAAVSLLWDSVAREQLSMYDQVLSRRRQR